jgi:hypothetical protein
MLMGSRSACRPPYVQKGYVAAEQDDLDNQV